MLRMFLHLDTTEARLNRPITEEHELRNLIVIQMGIDCVAAGLRDMDETSEEHQRTTPISNS